MSLLVLGTVALDTVETPFSKRVAMLGGSASHFSMSARLFTHVYISAVVGRDFPKKYLDLLRHDKIDFSSLIKTQGETFHWTGKYEGDMNAAITLGTKLGVLADFKPEISEEQRKIKYVFLANVDPEIQKYLLGKMKSPTLVGLDTMNYWISTKLNSLLDVVKRVDVFVVNDQEARSLTGETNLIKAAECLSSHGPKMILLKKGEHGVLFYSKKFKFCLPAYPIQKVIDPTGAGDTFAGGFMGYLAKAKKIDAKTIKKALGFATVAASFNVEGFGVERTSKLTLGVLNSRFNEFKKYILF